MSATATERALIDALKDMMSSTHRSGCPDKLLPIGMCVHCRVVRRRTALALLRRIDRAEPTHRAILVDPSTGIPVWIMEKTFSNDRTARAYFMSISVARRREGKVLTIERIVR